MALAALALPGRFFDLRRLPLHRWIILCRGFLIRHALLRFLTMLLLLAKGIVFFLAGLPFLFLRRLPLKSSFCHESSSFASASLATRRYDDIKTRRICPSRPSYVVSKDTAFGSAVSLHSPLQPSRVAQTCIALAFFLDASAKTWSHVETDLPKNGHIEPHKPAYLSAAPTRQTD